MTSSVALCALCAGATLAPGESRAAALYLQEQDALNIGRANAGAAAAGDAASTVFFNPAGMTNLDSAQADLSTTLLLPNVKFSDQGSTTTTPGSGGAPAPITGGNGGNPFGPTPIPNLYVAYPLMDRQLWVGFGLTAPFGLKLDYDEDWFGRYESTYTDLKTINAGPAIAYKVNEMLSIGGGVDIQYASARLESRIPNPLTPGGPTSATDARFRADGDSFALGFNAGVTVTPAPGTRLGLHYRYGISHELDGETRVSDLTGPLAAGNGRSDMKADLNLPDVVSLGISQQITPQLTLLGQVNYFNWDSYKEVRIRYDNGLPDQVSRQNYKDTWSFAIGAEYRWDDNWTFRTGFQWDQTPSSNPTFRSTRVPDGDRYYATVGASYRWSDMLSFDLAYAHVFMKDGQIDRTDTFFDGSPVATSVTTRGESEGSFDMIAVKGVLRF